MQLFFAEILGNGFSEAAHKNMVNFVFEKLFTFSYVTLEPYVNVRSNLR